MAVTYSGSRQLGKPEVLKTETGKGDALLDPSFGIRLHSPDGFNWGYGGSGPAQLALALLVDSVDRYEAEAIYQFFKFAVVANWSGDTWEMSQEEVRSWVKHFIHNNPKVKTEIEALRQYDTLTLGEELP